MSQENVALVKQAMDAINTGQLSAFVEFLDPAIVWETDPFVPEPGVYEGIEAVRSYLDGFVQAFGAMHLDVHEIVDLGGTDVLPVITIKGPPLGQTTGETQLFKWCLIDTVRNGKITRIRSFLDEGRAREAAGLSE
jgi:ketosteroid isomerase-like protein